MKVCDFGNEVIRYLVCVFIFLVYILYFEVIEYIGFFELLW